MERWVHKGAARRLLYKSEIQMMGLVRNGVLTGFDHDKNKVKHYGRWYYAQIEDDRLPIPILSQRVIYFDSGDIEGMRTDIEGERRIYQQEYSREGERLLWKYHRENSLWSKLRKFFKL